MQLSISSYSPGNLRILIAHIIICIQLSVFAQISNFNFEHLTTEDGLSSDKVEVILQDKEGFYWIATQNGLNRYDGTSFKIFRHISNDSTSLMHDYCTAMAEGKNGDIWIATLKGISRYIRNKGHFQSIYLRHPSINIDLTYRISNIVIDENGDAWIASNRLWKYDTRKDSLILFESGENDPSSVSDNSQLVFMVLDSAHHGIWFTTTRELNFYSFRQHQFFHAGNNPYQWKVFHYADIYELTMDYKNQLWFRDKRTQQLSYFDIEQNVVSISGKRVTEGIKNIYADKRNMIWICYWIGRSEIYDPESASTDTSFFSTFHSRSILNERGRSLFIDRQDNHWIASFKGISIYNEANQYYKLHQIKLKESDSEKKPLIITSLAQTEPGFVWISSNEELFKYDLRSESFKTIPLKSKGLVIQTLCSDNDKLWLNVGEHMVCLDTKRELIIRDIDMNSDIFFVRKGNFNDLWVGSWSNGLFRIDLATYHQTHFTERSPDSSGIIYNSLITGLVDSGYFWIGYNGGKWFSRYSVLEKSFDHFHPQQKASSHLHVESVTAIAKDINSHIWLGTFGGGLLQYDLERNTYKTFQYEQGLKSNFINGILPDSFGNLWISTADGMNYYNARKNSISQVDIDLVFYTNGVIPNALKGIDGKLYFFCIDMFAEIDPEAYRPDLAYPQVVISNFKIFDEEIVFPGANSVINLTHRQNFFSFEYSALKTQAGKGVHYAYMLEGFDEDWNEAGFATLASYTNVPDGHYQFKIKATNGEGQWSDVLLKIPVNIKPPYWRTWWFICLCIVMITSGIYALYRFRIHQIKKFNLLRSKISQDLHDELGSALSSIHVYSSVASKALDKNVDITKKALNHIFQNSRQVMDNMSDIVWAINQGRHGESTLENKLKNYGYELLTPLNIKVTYEIDKEAERNLNHMEARKNILLIAKEAMNNIARYSQATEAAVRVEIINRQLFLKIMDNGKGFSLTTKRNGNGLSNMQHRTEAMGGKFDLRSEENKGTSLTCSIPIANISNT